jgi:hypothetical protein
MRIGVCYLNIMGIGAEEELGAVLDNFCTEFSFIYSMLQEQKRF